MSKKHFEFLAKLVAGQPAGPRREAALEVALKLGAAFNPRFDAARFRAAVGPVGHDDNPRPVWVREYRDDGLSYRDIPGWSARSDGPRVLVEKTSGCDWYDASRVRPRTI